MKCISCENQSLEEFLVSKNSPACVQVIPKQALDKDKKLTVTVLKCTRCTLVQLSSKSAVKVEYYEDYLMSRGHSPFGEVYQKGLARKFVKEMNLANKSIVDVGCGDGYFTEFLKNEHAEVFGIEPSASACLLARKRGIKVDKAYVDENYKSKKTYDAFVTCQVFEHIKTPGKLLKNIKKFLKPDAAALIEIPSLIKTLRDDRFYDFFPDHVAYYTPTSLSYMLDLNGFDVISVNHTANDEYITAFARLKPIRFQKNSVTKLAEGYRQRYLKFMNSITSCRIALWGAGAKGITSLSTSNILLDNILYCVDSDPNKNGKFLPGSHIKVVSPDELKKDKPDVIVVTAMMYKEEIIERLMKEFGYKEDKIALIAPFPHFLSDR